MTLQGPYQLLNDSQRTVIATRVMMAQTLWQRAKGLLGVRRLEDGAALVIPRCNSIHTWGMSMTIDTIFIDASWQAVRLVEKVKPWRFIWPIPGAWGVVELSAGALQKVPVSLGDELRLVAFREGALP